MFELRNETNIFDLIVQVVQYNHPSYERDPNKMDWVDTKLEAEIGRINVNVDTSFVINIVVSKGGYVLQKEGEWLRTMKGVTYFN